MLLRLFYLIEVPFKLLQDIYPNYYSERVLHILGSFNVAKYIQPNRTSVILRMDKTGKILDTLFIKNVSDISSAYIYNGYLWLGSPWNEYIMRISLKQVFPNLAGNMKSLDIKEEKQEKPFLTVSAIPNVKIEEKSTKLTGKQEDVIKSSLKSTIKAQTTQKSNSDATISKSTTPKSINQQSSSISSKPSPSSSSSKTSKEVMKDNLKIEKDDLKEIKKDNFNSQIKSETSKKVSNEIKKDSKSQTKHEISNKNNEAKMKSNQPVKKDIHETQFGKSKFVKKDDNFNKK